MKKIFYSLMAVALCSCAQSDVEDVVTPPQPENKGLRFEVVDNGFVDEDGTRVTYGEYGSADNGAYKATFENDDQIGIYGITSMNEDGTPAAYAFENKPLTLKNGNWTSSESLDLTGVTVLFAYAPYRENANLADGAPLFTGAQGSWAVSTDNNRFFVWDFQNQDNGTKEKFDAADWMGAAVNLTNEQIAGTNPITFTMQHMRGMVELTTPLGVELTDLTLAVGGDNGTQYHFKPYHFATTTDKNVYRILTTEYRSTNTIYATIKDGAIETKYKNTPTQNGAGLCVRVNINNYKFASTFEAGEGTTLATYLTNNSNVEKLRLSGTLSSEDFAALKGFANKEGSTLTTLDMSELTNDALIDHLFENNTALTKLYLPNNLKTINWNSLQVKNVAHIDIPASVTTIGNGAFYYCEKTSIRIPDNSQLVSIGDGAFWNVPTLYTYENNKNMVVLPKSLTEIKGGNGYAFAVTSLKMIVFKNTAASTITIGDKALNGMTASFINVPNDTYKGKFPGKTVFIGPILTAKDYKSPYTVGDGGGLPSLCDNNITTHWHSTWNNEDPYGKPAVGDVTYGHYIDITVPNAMTKLAVMYATRYNNGNATPREINIYTGSDGETWGDPLFTLTKDSDELPQVAGKTFTTTQKTASASFTKIRFAVIKAKDNTDGTGVATSDLRDGTAHCTALGELLIAEDIWTDPAN